MQIVFSVLRETLSTTFKSILFFLGFDDFHKCLGYAASSNLQNTSLNLNLVKELPV